MNPVGGEALEEYYLGLLARKGRTLKPAVSLQAAKAGIKLHPSFERFHTLVRSVSLLSHSQAGRQANVAAPHPSLLPSPATCERSQGHILSRLTNRV